MAVTRTSACSALSRRDPGSRSGRDAGRSTGSKVAKSAIAVSKLVSSNPILLSIWTMAHFYSEGRWRPPILRGGVCFVDLFTTAEGTAIGNHLIAATVKEPDDAVGLLNS